MEIKVVRGALSSITLNEHRLSLRAKEEKFHFKYENGAPEVDSGAMSIFPSRRGEGAAEAATQPGLPGRPRSQHRCRALCAAEGLK